MAPNKTTPNKSANSRTTATDKKVVRNGVKKDEANKKNGPKKEDNKKLAKTEVETRTALLQKVKLYEEDIERFEIEKMRLVQELDRVCEEKDTQVRELKTLVHEKQTEIDHQLSVVQKQKAQFDGEADGFRNEIQKLTDDFKNKENVLTDKITDLEFQLADLNDYIQNKHQTMAKLKELEETIKQERVVHRKVKEKLAMELSAERRRVEEEVACRVEEITASLEANCMQKLSIDAKVAIEKYLELSRNYEHCEVENAKLRSDNKTLKAGLNTQRIRFEVADSLLNEMLKQMSRRLQARRDVGVQCEQNMVKSNKICF